MKKFKGILSVVLSFIMLCSFMILPVNAEERLPESEHYYQNNFYGEWDYIHPDPDVAGLFVTFSENTMTEDEGYYEDIYFEEDEEITVGDVIDVVSHYKMGDIIYVYDGHGELVDFYQGDALAGKTIYVPGSSFKITLVTDSSITAYGFKVENVTVDPPKHATIFRLHMPDGSIKKIVDLECPYGEYEDEFDFDYEINYYYSDFLSKYENFISGNEAVIGWTAPDGKELYYALMNTYSPVQFKHGIYDFYAITTPVQLTSSDVYNFTNSSKYFNFDGDGYYMTRENYLRLLSSVCLAGGATPLALPAAIVNAVLISYPEHHWVGSCIGFANTVCLQKKGILDVVSTQEGATCMRDLEPTPELISLINYYNAESAASFLPKDKAFRRGTEEYTRQIKKLVGSALDGNLILFEFVPSGTAITDVFNDYHAIVITGAYELPEGGYVLLYYDENDSNYSGNGYGSNYASGYCNEIYVPADYSTISNMDYYDTLFFWTDTFDEYKALDINGASAKDYSVFRLGFLKHIIEVIREWFEYYILRFFK